MLSSYHKYAPVILNMLSTYPKYALQLSVSSVLSPVILSMLASFLQYYLQLSSVWSPFILSMLSIYSQYVPLSYLLCCSVIPIMIFSYRKYAFQIYLQYTLQLYSEFYYRYNFQLSLFHHTVKIFNVLFFQVYQWMDSD